MIFEVNILSPVYSAPVCLLPCFVYWATATRFHPTTNTDIFGNNEKGAGKCLRFAQSYLEWGGHLYTVGIDSEMHLRSLSIFLVLKSRVRHLSAKISSILLISRTMSASLSGVFSMWQFEAISHDYGPVNRTKYSTICDKRAYELQSGATHQLVIGFTLTENLLNRAGSITI